MSGEGWRGSRYVVHQPRGDGLESLHREYLDVTLPRLTIERGHRPPGWSAAAIRTYREAIQCIDAATTEADLRAMRSLRMRERPELKPGAWSIPLDDDFTLVLTFKNDGLGAAAVLELLDYELGRQR